jgi:hypothetical protein
MWRMWFITGLTAGHVAVVIALHHAIADGAATIKLLTTFLDPAGVSDSPAWNAASPPWHRLVTDHVQTKLDGLGRLQQIDPRRRVASLRAGRRVLAHAWRAPRTSLTGPIGRRRDLAVLRLDLDAARQVAHRYGGKINDVVLDLAAGGIGALLRSRGMRSTGSASTPRWRVRRTPPNPRPGVGTDQASLWSNCPWARRSDRPTAPDQRGQRPCQTRPDARDRAEGPESARPVGGCCAVTRVGNASPISSRATSSGHRHRFGCSARLLST